MKCEQARILRTVDRSSKSLKGREWTKYKGDIVARIIAHYLKNHIPKGFKISDPYAYIAGSGTEYDYLIVKNDSSQTSFSNAYKLSDVYATLEIKLSGIFMKREELKNT
jgi:hypothetical protein